ncbi:MAG: pyrroline-5-carboxylate reductase [Lachnospiraceae bacterium]|nr:pyrroline-5-carboxylate reductase [Lachnospiraceae bacterium]
MKKGNVGFIGTGNMAKAIIGGMLEKGIVSAENIIGADKMEAAVKETAERFKIQTTTDNKVVAENAEIIFLAVKPQFLAEAVAEIKDYITEEHLIISIAAGRTMQNITDLFGKEIRLVRCMPNTPALVGEGCTGVCRNEKVTNEDMERVMKLLTSFGSASEVSEHLMDAVVGVSGSSPAYVFMFIEALADATVAAGMPRNQAYQFAAQAVLGSAKMVLETGKHPGELKDMVCSPAGTTIEAVKVLEEKGFRAAVMDAVEACVNKSRNM